MNSEWADPDEVASWAEGKSQGVLKCRTSRNHWWDGWAARPLTEDPKIRGRIAGAFEWRYPLQQIQRCTRCKKVIRKLTIHPFTGKVLHRTSAQYLEGYLLEPGMGRIDEDGNGQLRLMVMSVDDGERERPRLRKVG
ncbi:hypothetical protein AB0P21_09845 [Kribbella sp. NPDC056861]|uniref:hypothetical protein n=1 Tax=Kribbella sp. NPDC056861 TaxID=3154857 RepID=UPI00342A5F63